MRSAGTQEEVKVCCQSAAESRPTFVSVSAKSELSELSERFPNHKQDVEADLETIYKSETYS